MDGTHPALSANAANKEAAHPTQRIGLAARALGRAVARAGGCRCADVNTGVVIDRLALRRGNWRGVCDKLVSPTMRAYTRAALASIIPCHGLNMPSPLATLAVLNAHSGTSRVLSVADYLASNGP
jgi:hypothetical protein